MVTYHVERSTEHLSVTMCPGTQLQGWTGAGKMPALLFTQLCFIGRWEAPACARGCPGAAGIPWGPGQPSPPGASCQSHQEGPRQWSLLTKGQWASVPWEAGLRARMGVREQWEQSTAGRRGIHCCFWNEGCDVVKGSEEVGSLLGGLVAPPAKC